MSSVPGVNHPMGNKREYNRYGTLNGNSDTEENNRKCDTRQAKNSEFMNSGFSDNP